MLAITAQLILVFSFFSTILLKADMAGEVLTHGRVGVLMVVVNLPMALFFVWDVRLDVVEHFAAVEEYMSSHSVVRTEQGDGGSRNDVRRGASPARSSTPPLLDEEHPVLNPPPLLDESEEHLVLNPATRSIAFRVARQQQSSTPPRSRRVATPTRRAHEI